MSDIVFMDTETLGLDPLAPVWEFAAIRRYENGIEAKYHCFIDHDPAFWLDLLPAQFQEDYKARFDAQQALKRADAAEMIHTATDGAHVVGAVPSFDTERLARILNQTGWGAPPWHYHLIDIENVVTGYLHGVAARAIDEARMRGEEPDPALVNRPGPPYKSDDLSRAVNVDPNDFDRHTAMGDVLWTRAQWDAVMGNGDE
ncbi:hypothetical protein [Mycobacteroides abscessus]|uniref:hypothetical protein n=1 Tax=Mycobacteroides abscessus TaxID=36809 RepID=UPI0021050980|nr:hypothetical protein [Mycobacteroides abscessus]